MPAPVRALTFDVFGTVVDWRGSIIREGEAFAATHGLHLDWSRFAAPQRAACAPALNLVPSAFVTHPLASAPARPDTLSHAPGFDFYATGFLDLAQQRA